jgi:hypothetical protein
METELIEIRLPGSMIRGESNKNDLESFDHVEAVVKLFYEACAALYLFEEIQNKYSPSLIDLDHSERAAEIFKDYLNGYAQNSEDQRELFYEAESRAKKELWDRGVLPNAITVHRTIIAARAFVYALDGFREEIVKISKNKNAIVQLKEMPEKFDKYFPHLKAIRDSCHHIADRRRGVGRVKNKSTPIKAKSHDFGFMNIPEGTIQLAILIDSKFGCTLADGSFGSIEIDSDSLRLLRKLLDELVNCYKWESHPITYPLK